jgi:hypothetical protein
MRHSALLLAALAAVAIVPGCVSGRDEPVRVTVINPPPSPVYVEGPPTVIVREETVSPVRPLTSPTATTAAPTVHGQRYRVVDVDVIYNEPIQAYTVVGYDDRYYTDGRFYRYDRDGWQSSSDLQRDARWVRVRDRDVPDSLLVLHQR